MGLFHWLIGRGGRKMGDEAARQGALQQVYLACAAQEEYRHGDPDKGLRLIDQALVRKATSVRPREMVVNWLYGVAHQSLRLSPVFRCVPWRPGVICPVAVRRSEAGNPRSRRRRGFSHLDAPSRRSMKATAPNRVPPRLCCTARPPPTRGCTRPDQTTLVGRAARIRRSRSSRLGLLGRCRARRIDRSSLGG
jgi:hypothetical protein